MGCLFAKKSKSKYDVIIEEEEKEYFLNIYQESNPDEYIISGTLFPNVKQFYLIFKKQDEERLPIAFTFEISDETFISNQYQFLKICPDEKKEELSYVHIQYPEDELSSIYSCQLSPSFPFPVDINAKIKLKP